MNHAYAETNGQPFRVVRDQVNIGIAVDVAGKDGTRSLKVPNIKDAGSMDFAQFITAFDDIIFRARNNKLTVPDFEGTTISLTNPGTVGTFGSVPRLMPGQGAIIATGAIDYPAEYHGVTEQLRALLGLSKVMTVTCTYDHRVIQGAESGSVPGRLQALLEGEDGFYEKIFSDLKIPHKPVHWEPDRTVSIPGLRGAQQDEVVKEAAVLQLINAYRVRGHLIADFDPLGSEPVYHSELDPATYGLTIWDLDREFLTGTLMSEDDQPQKMATLREILETLRQTYCGKIGCEYMNIQIPEQKRWLQLRMEPTGNRWPLDPQTKLRALERIIEAEEFERFLHTRFIGHKRFSLEGGESAIAILDEILDRAADTNVHEAVIGMAHRGRLNVLANIVGKSMVQVFSEFEGIDPDSTQGSGDVKYHLGASGVRKSVVRPRNRRFGGVQSKPSGSGGSGGGRSGASQAGPAGRHGPRACDSHSDSRRRRFRRTGRGGGDAESFATGRLHHRRHHPSGDQQPDRIHHQSERSALDALFHRRGAHGAGADLPRQRRRSGSLHSRGADGLRLSPDASRTTS